MSNNAALFRNSLPFFVLIPLFAVWGFWPTYFAQVVRPISWIDHAHGIAMFGWCAMLILQSYLIRSGNRRVHRATGKISYALMPVIVVSTLMLANQQINARGLTGQGLYILMLQITILPQLVIFYTLAIINRKSSDVHARYMICTALPLIDPIFARIMFQVLPTEQMWLTQYITFGLTDLVLIGLITWDWRAGRRHDVFLPMLFVLLVLQLPVFTAVSSDAWANFANWFMRLPLS